MNNKNQNQDEQKTIFEKWEEDEITILPPKKSKKEILKELRDPDTPEAEKDKLMNMLYDGIDVK